MRVDLTNVYISETDIVGRLPVEISLAILERLSIRDLAACSMVSRRWRLLATDDRLWARLTENENLDRENLAPPPAWECRCSVKRRYCLRQNSVRRWERNKWWVVGVGGERELAVVANGAVVVEAEGGRLTVHDLNDGWPGRRLQSVEPPAGCRGYCGVEAFSDLYLVMRTEGGLLCYGWDVERAALEWIGGVYAGRRCCGRGTVLGCAPGGGGRRPTLRCVAVGEGGSLLLKTEEEPATAYVWLAREARCSGLIDCRGIADGAIRSRDDQFYFCTRTNQLVMCDSTGVRRATLRFEPVGRLVSAYWIHFNAELVVLELAVADGGLYLVLAYERRSLKRIGEAFTEHEGLVLHPSRPWICSCKGLSNRLWIEVSLEDLSTGSVVWRLDLKPVSGEFALRGRDSGHLRFVAGRYVAFLVFDGRWKSDLERFLIDAATGKIIFGDSLEKYNAVEYLGEKLMVLWNSRRSESPAKNIFVYT